MAGDTARNSIRVAPVTDNLTTRYVYSVCRRSVGQARLRLAPDSGGVPIRGTRRIRTTVGLLRHDK